MVVETQGVEQALQELERIAPGVDLLALGQTVFWDEPMKAGIALALRKMGLSQKLVAGVHDTDYFAKLPSGETRHGKFKALPHNDTTTRGLWSAAGEFSALFGSETVVRREALLAAGLRLGKVQQSRPNLLDEATEAWGWRGIVSTDDEPMISAEIPLRSLFPELKATFDWALNESLDCIAIPERRIAEDKADELREIFCEASEGEDLTLPDFYQRLLPDFYRYTSNSEVEVATTRTTELLRFNSETCRRSRFDLLRLFVEPASRLAATEAYNAALEGSEIYGLERFGSGAVPFDVVVPGQGRGTLRIAPNALVIMARKPLFVSLRKPIETLEDLASALEARFGQDCVIIGKAVTLIGMLAREFVFVFHEGASPYVKHSRKMHDLMAQSGLKLDLHPILRVRYEAWDALQQCCSWLRLPAPFQRAFGTEEICAPSLSRRWREVAREQESILSELGELRRPIELIRFLDERLGGFWNELAAEYESLHSRLMELDAEIAELRKQRLDCYRQLRELKARRVEAERTKGEHWRATLFEKEPTPEASEERERLTQEVREAILQIDEMQRKIAGLLAEQRELVRDPEVMRIHERRRSIELEAELRRLRLARNAIISSKGLIRASHRPSAWWFPLVCPDGLWFRETVGRAECYLEPLVS
jgi:hypothetical protein